MHLIELSPPVLRSFVLGVTYQLGNLASSASSTIEATIGERYPIAPAPNGDERYDYGKVIGIFLGAVWAYILFFTFLGPEMTQEERNEEAAATQEFEDLRAQGVSLQEIGANRARMEGKSEKMELADEVEQLEDMEKATMKRAEGG